MCDGRESRKTSVLDFSSIPIFILYYKNFVCQLTNLYRWLPCAGTFVIVSSVLV